MATVFGAEPKRAEREMEKVLEFEVLLSNVKASKDKHLTKFVSFMISRCFTWMIKRKRSQTNCCIVI